MKEANVNEAILKAVSDKERLQQCLLSWGKQNYRCFPWRVNRTPYSILVAELLLKRTTAMAVDRLYVEFLSKYPDIAALHLAEPEGLQTLLSRLGYHKVRTKIICEITNTVMKRFDGKIPETKKELLEIPHVGPYTAGAIMCFALGRSVAIVDTNVERILKRVFLGLLPQTTSLKPVCRIADILVPDRHSDAYNYSLLDLGALVCKSGLPRCPECPINRACNYSLLGKPFRH
jgi:A/G-specific adenine glycosylase